VGRLSLLPQGHWEETDGPPAEYVPVPRSLLGHQFHIPWRRQEVQADPLHDWSDQERRVEIQRFVNAGHFDDQTDRMSMQFERLAARSDAVRQIMTLWRRHQAASQNMHQTIADPAPMARKAHFVAAMAA